MRTCIHTTVPFSHRVLWRPVYIILFPSLTGCYGDLYTYHCSLLSQVAMGTCIHNTVPFSHRVLSGSVHITLFISLTGCYVGRPYMCPRCRPIMQCIPTGITVVPLKEGGCTVFYGIVVGSGKRYLRVYILIRFRHACHETRDRQSRSLVSGQEEGWGEVKVLLKF